MVHLGYCLREILAIRYLVKVKNSSFRKRSIARLIAVRLDDFIKIAFAVNKSTINNQAVRDQTNELKQYYDEYFKLLRNKMSAHFQDIDFARRIEVWNQIDLDKVEFFSDAAIDIYKRLSSNPNATPVEVLVHSLSEEDIRRLEQINDKYDIEKYPHFSSDILTHSRYNSGGLVHFSTVQHKAGTLKAIELLTDYEIAVIKQPLEIWAKKIYKKMLVIDFISYYDNFITRKDLREGAQQDEPGLDFYLLENEFPTGHNTMSLFKSSFNYDQVIDKIRLVRNKCCGHIDIRMPIEQIESLLDSLEASQIESLYNQHKSVFKQICTKEFLLKTFLIDASERLYGVNELRGFEQIPFDEESTPASKPKAADINDEIEYEKFLSEFNPKLVRSEAQSFFFEAFASSNLVERRMFLSTIDGRNKSEYYEFRAAHQFLSLKLSNPQIDKEIKVKIIELLVATSGGFPRTSLSLLLDTFEVNKDNTELHLYYVYGIGELCHERNDNILKLLTSNYLSNGPNLRYHCLLAILKIDVRASIRSNDPTTNTAYFNFIHSTLSQSETEMMLVYSITLKSELIFGLRHYLKSGKSRYNNFFENAFNTSCRKLFRTIATKPLDRRRVDLFISLYKKNRFSTLVAAMTEFFEKKNHRQKAFQFRSMILDGAIKFSGHDNTEVFNFALIAAENQQIERAIAIAEELTSRETINFDYYRLLLQLYLKDLAFKEKFTALKAQLLQHFQLTDSNKDELNGWSYNR